MNEKEKEIQGKVIALMDSLKEDEVKAMVIYVSEKNGDVESAGFVASLHPEVTSVAVEHLCKNDVEFMRYMEKASRPIVPHRIAKSKVIRSMFAIYLISIAILWVCIAINVRNIMVEHMQMDARKVEFILLGAMLSAAIVIGIKNSRKHE